MTRTRLKPEVRRDQILTAAIEVAKRDGFANITRDAVATHAGVSNGQVNHMFNTMTQLRRAVMRAAVHREILPIVAAGLAGGDSEAHKAPEWLKRNALDTLLTK